MFGVSKPTLVGAMMIFAVAPAMAADILPDPIPVQPAPAFGGWYLRGHIGMTNQALDNLDTDLYRDPYISAHGWHDGGNFDSSPLFGGGIGYQFNEWFRADVMAEYRGKSDFRAVDWVTTTFPGNPGTYTNDYSAQKSEWLIMANAYADLGTFGGVTPYVGAGIGASRNTISGFRDVNVLRGGAAWAPEESQWNLAWALHAGLGIAVTERTTIDLGYSFVSLGDARTGPLANDDPAYTLPNDGFRFNDLTSHDLKVGVRYSFY